MIIAGWKEGIFLSSHGCAALLCKPASWSAHCTMRTSRSSRWRGRKTSSYCHWTLPMSNGHWAWNGECSIRDGIGIPCMRCLVEGQGSVTIDRASSWRAFCRVKSVFAKGIIVATAFSGVDTPPFWVLFCFWDSRCSFVACSLVFCWESEY